MFHIWYFKDFNVTQFFLYNTIVTIVQISAAGVMASMTDYIDLSGDTDYPITHNQGLYRPYTKMHC